MNSSPDNFSLSDDGDRSVSEAESIDLLIDILLDSESFAKNETEGTFDLNPKHLDSEIVEPDPELSIAEEPNLVDDNPEYPDLEVEIESAKPDITLEEAVEYEAFLRQTVDSEPKSEPNISDRNNLETIEKTLEIETQKVSTEELVASVNGLIPLIVELLKYKIDEDRETLLEAITPVIEQLIERRAQAEPKKMALAIAQILPSAITEKIQLSPEEIAKAIAPELALSFKEQIRLDENAISEALG